MEQFNKPLWRTVKPVATPVAGGVFTFQPGSNGGWLVRSLRFLLATDATAATRLVMLQALHAEDIYMQTAAVNGQTANNTNVYSYVAGQSGGANVTNMLAMDGPTDGIWLPQGHVLRAAVSNIQAGDLFTQVVARVVEYPTGPNREVWPYGPGVALPAEFE